jgi:hypothetical protein
MVTLTLEQFLKLLKAMHGDHANDQKKTVRLMLGRKTETIPLELGREAISSLTEGEVRDILAEISEQCIKDAGGLEKWNGLPALDKADRKKAGMDTLALRMGKEVFQKLPEETQRELDLFFWAGCGMHKGLNVVAWAYAGASTYWERNNLALPVLLANKDNDAAI